MDALFVRAWLFLSVTEAPERLWSVMAWADFIMHAVPLIEELQAGLGWLISAGLVETKDGLFWLTDKGKALLEACGGRRGSPMKAVERVRARLARITLNHWTPLPLTPEEVDKAYKEYTREINRIYREWEARQALASRALTFLAIRETPTELWEVLVAADLLERGVILYNDLRNALGWLMAAGLIQETDGRWSRTPEGQRLMDECRRSEGVETLADAKAWLEKRFSEMAPKRSRPYPLTPETYKAAHTRFLQESQRDVLDDTTQ
ncbi:MAG: winged helix-turn-helix domain-containing protein [Fimbriimonadales bacterium]|nr:winged helix-turn-helix domain-containing protein [Fimbriimonadales bacterium]